MKNEEWLTPLVFLTSLLFILPSNAGNTVAASLYYNTADNNITKQQDNKTTRQQNNKTTKQQNNKTTKQHILLHHHLAEPILEDA